MLHDEEVMNLVRRIRGRIIHRYSTFSTWHGYAVDQSPLFFTLLIAADPQISLLLRVCQVAWREWSLRLELSVLGETPVPLRIWSLDSPPDNPVWCIKCLKHCLDDCDGQTCPVDLTVEEVPHYDALGVLASEIMRGAWELAEQPA